MKKNFNRYQIKINGREVEIARWIPGKAVSSSPILVSPGWTTTYSLIEQVLLELTNLEREVYVIVHPRVKNPKPDDDEFDGYQHCEAENILGVVDNMELKKVDLVAHSSGAIGASIAAGKRPRRFRSLTLFNPSGLVNESSFFVFAMRCFQKGFDDTYQTLVLNRRSRSVYWSHYAQGAKYMFSHLFQSMKELYGISKASVAALLDDIRSKDIAVTIIAGDEDIMYPLKKMSEMAKSHVDSFKVARGWHEAIIFNPAYYTKLLSEVLKRVDANRAKSSK